MMPTVKRVHSGVIENMLKRFRSTNWLGAGLVMSAPQQESAEVVGLWMAVIVIGACLLPIFMAIFGAVALRFIGGIARGPSEEDEVVQAAPTLPEGVHLPDPTIWPAILSFGLMGVIFGLVLESWLLLLLGVPLALLGLLGWIVIEMRDSRLKRGS